LFRSPLSTNISSRVVLHVDFDYFYVQCEEMRDPHLKTVPAVVCVYSGRNIDAGVISSSNYSARELGVKSGMPIKTAKIKLAKKDAAFLPMDMPYYKEISTTGMEVIRSLSNAFEYVGIDECYVEMTKTSNCDFIRSKDIAKLIQKDLFAKANLTVSIGIAPSRLVAKIASNFRKPNAITVVSPEDVKAFMTDCKIADIPGIGPKNIQRLEALDLLSVRELAKADLFRLKELFGYKMASYLRNAANGIDMSPLRPKQKRKQIGRIVTLKSNVRSIQDATPILMELCASVYDTLLRKGLSYGNIIVILILNNLVQITASRTIKLPSTSLEELQFISRSLVIDTLGHDGLSLAEIRRIGITISDLSEEAGQRRISEY
jgi:DNA polymerase IV (archaeal DinB-like DNA polymerase)